MSQCRITVLKRCINQEIIREYIAENDFDLCPKFMEGQAFILDYAEKPEGFCSWAWADIQRDLAAIMYGADFPWFTDSGRHVVCCTDGLRPVVFLIEHNQGKTVLIVSHMVAILLILLRLSGDRVENVWKIGKQPNTAISIVELDSFGHVELLINGDNSHLGESDVSKPKWDAHGEGSADN